MTSKVSRYPRIIIWLAVFGTFLAACGNGTETPTASLVPPTPSPQPPTHTPTPFQPSPTPIPLAALVNGEALTLAEYQSELARASSGTNLASGAGEAVLDDLINQTLLAQGATESGFVLDEATLQARIDGLASPEALNDWLAANGYTGQDFRRALARQIAAAWMRDQIVNAVPWLAEQAHARQILLYNSTEAEQVLAQIRGGADFAELAAAYDPLRAGDLDWFPRGYLTEPALEEAAFALQPGETSSVIATRLGYHILQAIAREPQRLLTSDARQALQERALHNWLDQRRSQSDIQVFIP